MADALTYWRKTNRLTQRSETFGIGETGPTSNHRGDFVTACKTGHVPSPEDRTDFAVVLITDIPAAVVQKARRWLQKGTTVNPETPDEPGVIDRPRILRLDVDLLKTEYPALANKIDKLFDPTFTLPLDRIPSLTWAKFRKAVWNKVGSVVVPEAQWETDPDGD